LAARIRCGFGGSFRVEHFPNSEAAAVYPLRPFCLRRNKPPVGTSAQQSLIISV